MGWWVPLLSVIVGGVLTICSTIAVELYRTNKKGNAIKSALISEISGLLTIAKHRKYLESLKEMLEQFEDYPDAEHWFTIKVPSHYSRIYQENSKDIGLLNKKLASDIIIFHQLIDSVIQDVTPGGVIADGAGCDAFKECYFLLESAVALGNKIVEDHRKITK